MLLDELKFLNDCVNYGNSKYLTQQQMHGELHKLLKIMINLKVKKNDKDNILLLVEHKDKIDFNFYDEQIKITTKNKLKEIVNLCRKNILQYEEDLDSFLKTDNAAIVSEIENVNDIKINNLQFLRILCFMSAYTMRNGKEWKQNVGERIFKNSEKYTNSFVNYLIIMLKQIKDKTKILSHSVKINYHFSNLQINYSNSIMKPGLIVIETAKKNKSENKQDELEICYVLNNSLCPEYENDNQHNSMFSSFIQLNALPYLLFNNILSDDQAITVFNLYKSINTNISQTKLIEQVHTQTFCWSHVLIVNSIVDKPKIKSVYLNKLNTYYNVLKSLKFNYTIVGNFEAYKENSHLAALDFIILMFVASITNRNLKYKVIANQEYLFQKLKNTVCKMKTKDVYNTIINYDVIKKPMENFKIDYQSL